MQRCIRTMGITKKLTTFALAVLALGLAGCQPSGDAGKTAAGPNNHRFKVGVSIPAADHGWTAGIKYWADVATKDNPDIDWIVQDAKEPNAQISDLENMKTQGVDAIVILPTESAPLTPIVQKLHDAGILVINVDRGLNGPVADVHIEGDNKAFGTKSANFIVQKLGGKGDLAVLTGIPSTVDTDRVTAAMAVFAQYPGIRIVAKDSGMWNRDKAEKVMENMLAGNPHIDAIWAADDDMALGCESALKAAGRDKNIWILGGGCMKDVVKRLMAGDPLFPGEITYPPSMIAYGVETAAAMLRAGKDHAKQYTPRHVVLDVDIVTKDDAKDYYFPDSVY